MKHHHSIVDLTEDQKEYQAYFKKMLKKYKVDSPASLDKDKKKEFFNAVDKGWKAKSEGVKEGRDEFIDRMKSNVKLRRDLIRRTSVVQEDAPSLDNDDNFMNKGATTDKESSGEKSQLVVEFPDMTRVEFTCKPEDVEAIKTKAQELHDEGKEITEIANQIVEDFPGTSFEIDGGEKHPVVQQKKDDDKLASPKKGKENEEKAKKKVEKVANKKVKEGFRSFIEGIISDPGKQIRESRNDKVISDRVERKLYRINDTLKEINEEVKGATPSARSKILMTVKENLEAATDLLLENPEDLEESSVIKYDVFDKESGTWLMSMSGSGLTDIYKASIRMLRYNPLNTKSYSRENLLVKKSMGLLKQTPSLK